MNPAIVSSIIKEGSVINTKLGSNGTWYTNIVYKCENNAVSLSLLDSYLNSLIMNGSKITLKHTNEFFEYLFEGSVSYISPGHPSYVTVTINRAEELVNTRTFPRYDVYLPSSIKHVWDEKECFSIVTNICLGGIAFVSDHDFDYGDEFDFHIFLPEDKAIIGKGKIIRKCSKAGFFEYSMQFTDMTEENSITLSDYMLLHDENAAAMQKHFFHNIKGRI